MKIAKAIYERAQYFCEYTNDGGLPDARDTDWLVDTVTRAIHEDKDREALWREILNDAGGHDDWDATEMVSFASKIMDCLEQEDKVYNYRAVGDAWEVYSWLPTGRIERKGLVETETIAKSLVVVLSQQLSDIAGAASLQKSVDALSIKVLENGGSLSGGKMVVNFSLCAHTRMEYAERVIVPAEFNNETLGKLIDSSWSSVEGYSRDVEYFERGPCSNEIIEEFVDEAK